MQDKWITKVSTISASAHQLKRCAGVLTKIAKLANIYHQIEGPKRQRYNLQTTLIISNRSHRRNIQSYALGKNWTSLRNCILRKNQREDKSEIEIARSRTNEKKKTCRTQAKAGRVHEVKYSCIPKEIFQSKHS